MISFRDPELPAGTSVVDLPPVKSAVRAYLEFVERTFRDAIIRHIGYLPPDEEIIRHGRIFCTPDGHRHLCWLEEPPVVGEFWPAEKCIASVTPFYPISIPS